MDSMAPWRLIVVKFFTRLFGTDVICNVAASPLADLICVVGRRTDRNSRGGRPMEVAKVVGDLFKVVCP